MNGNIGLVRAINTGFDLEELKTLCYEMSKDFDDLPGDGSMAKARELVEWSEREGLLVKLVMTCAAQRPNMFWDDALANLSPVEVQQTLPKLSGSTSKKLQGWQIAQLTATTNRLKAEFSRFRIVTTVVLVAVAANMALTSYLVLLSIFK